MCIWWLPTIYITSETFRSNVHLMRRAASTFARVAAVAWCCRVVVCEAVAFDCRVEVNCFDSPAASDACVGGTSGASWLPSAKLVGLYIFLGLLLSTAGKPKVECLSSVVLIVHSSITHRYRHPEVDRLGGISGIGHGSLKDHILSIPG